MIRCLRAKIFPAAFATSCPPPCGPKPTGDGPYNFGRRATRYASDPLRQRSVARAWRERLSPRRSLRRSQGWLAWAKPRLGGAWPRRRAGGFTMIELLVVLVILGLIAAFAVPQVMKYLGRAKTDAAGIQIQNLSTVLDLYRLDTGRYPNQDEGLDALFENPSGAGKWNGPYVKRRDRLVDPWGNEYRYRFPGQHAEYDIYSLGADNADGGDGENSDVTSW